MCYVIRDMHLSWSHKLFLKINAHAGKRPWLDVLMIFCAKWLIFVMAIVWWLSLVAVDWSKGSDYYGPRLWELSVVYLGIEIVLALVVSYIIGFLWKHSRPIVEFPEIKELFKPLTTWKSFPSDHALIAFLIALDSMIVGMRLDEYSLQWGIVLLISALFVAMGRIYAGVHYPRDVVSSFALALVFFLLFDFRSAIFYLLL